MEYWRFRLADGECGTIYVEDPATRSQHILYLTFDAAISDIRTLALGAERPDKTSALIPPQFSPDMVLQLSSQIAVRGASMLNNVLFPSRTDGEVWSRSGVDSTYFATRHVALEPAFSAWLRELGRSQVQELVLSDRLPGEYFARIWRETPVPLAQSENPSTYAQSVLTVDSLFDEAYRLFSYIQPSPRNDDVFSLKIRQLMLLACTEVETAWKGVLSANSYASRSNLTTRDYVKLLGPMKLSDWSIRLNFYPDYPAVSPFRGWDAARPTQSLPWYHAYNQVKHDRETNLQEARLKYAIQALAAAYVMNSSQFGPDYLETELRSAHDQIRIVETPEWPCRDQYVPPYPMDGDDWVRVDCPL